MNKQIDFIFQFPDSRKSDNNQLAALSTYQFNTSIET